MRRLLTIALFGCSSSPTPAQRPQATPTPSVDASIDAAPDAGISEAVTSAPAWIFRYNTPQRSETWTLRFHGDSALLVVETAKGAMRYIGSAKDGTSLALDVTTGTAKLTLDCKHTKRAVSAKCNDTKAKPIEVLDCYVPDFKEPMPFAPAPGIEYVTSPGCNGYRSAKP